LPGNPARPDDIVPAPDGPAPRAAAAKASRDPSGTKIAKLEKRLESLCTSFVNFVRFVVWSVVDGYNYQLIVIANRRHCFPNPALRKTALPETSTPDSKA